MITNKTNKLLSIVGGDYFYPIALLLEKLFSLNSPQVNEDSVQAPHIENGFSAAICILLVVTLESYLARHSAIEEPDKSKSRKDSGNFKDFFRNKWANFNYIKELDEIYALRDCLVHNHLHELEYNNLTMRKQGSEKYVRSGNQKYPHHVDSTTSKTKILRLNVNPIRVDREDVKKVLKVVWNTLSFLEEKTNEKIKVSHLMVISEGSRNVDLKDFVEKYIR